VGGYFHGQAHVAFHKNRLCGGVGGGDSANGPAGDGPFRRDSLVLFMPVALGLLLIPAYYHLKRNMVRYTLTDSKIEIDYGLIARTTRNIPLAKIQDVTVSASIPQRILGFGNVIVDNASEIGGTTVLHNINDPRHYADLILRELRRWH